MVMMRQVLEARDCGACTVCCTVTPIDEPELQKQSGTPCQHCVDGAGCAIYAKRPDVCRTSYCGWRFLPELDDPWRPDLSGVLVLFDNEHIPPHFDQSYGIKLLLTQAPETAIDVRVIGYVAALVRRRVPVFVAVAGPPGFFFAKSFLNDRLEGNVRRQDVRGLEAELRRVVAILKGGPFERVALRSRAG